MDIEGPPDVIVVAGGAPVERDLAPSPSTPARVVAADSGVARALALGLSVDVAVGDFDSLSADLLAGIDDIAGEVRRHPTDKDATDLELALRVAAEGGPGRVLVVGIEGGRPDHALANLLLVGAPRFAELEIELVLALGRVWVVHDELRGHREPDEVLSVLPVHGDAVVSITGVRWPLEVVRLPAGSSRGVSNETAGGPMTLTVHDGTALCIAPRPTPPTTERDTP